MIVYIYVYVYGCMNVSCELDWESNAFPNYRKIVRK
jgi:hypothetical protein